MSVDRIIAGKYQLVEKLSKGGMGSVWRAHHIELNCPVAIKLLEPTFAESPEALARFRREAQAAASLRSANIVQVLDFGVDRESPYIAMELLNGESLADRLEACRPLPQVEAIDVLTQTARAVNWAHHMGIIHRDLKPGNIFIANDAGERVVKLVDFGIAKPLQLTMADAQVTTTGSIMGTPQYMSPEQASARRVVDHRADIWSFGIIAYECLTGHHAFEGETLAGLLLAICTDPLPIPSQVASVPYGFDQWFSRCAHRDPDQRFQSISEAAQGLREICGFGATVIVKRIEQIAVAGPGHCDPVEHSANEADASAVTDAPSILAVPAEHRSPRKKVSKVGAVVVLVGLVLISIAAVRLSHTGANGATQHSAVHTTSTNVASVASLAVSGGEASPGGEHDRPASVLPVATVVAIKGDMATPENRSLPQSAGHVRIMKAKVASPRGLSVAETGEPAVGSPQSAEPAGDRTVEQEFGFSESTVGQARP